MIKKTRRTLIPVFAAAMLLFSLAPMSTVAMSEQPKEIDLTINQEKSTITTSAKTIKGVLASVDYEHKSTDKINYELDDRVLGEMEIVVSSEKGVSLSVKGEKTKSFTNVNTVEEFLKEVNVEVSKDDIVIPALDSQLNKKEEIAIIYHEETEYKTSHLIDFKINEDLSFEVHYGETKVAVEGEKGNLDKTFKKITKNDILVSDEKVSENITKKPVDKKILIGTKEIINKEIANKTVSNDNSSIFKGESKVIQEGNKGNEQSIYKNNGKDRSLVSTEITKKAVDRIVEVGTKVKPKPKPKAVEKSASTTASTNSSAQYSLKQFKYHGVVNSGGKKYTYYSQSVLPGGGLKIPGRHVNAGGYVADSSGYIVVATNRSIPKGSIVNTPFGYQGKVYDTCAACTPNWIDIYTQ